MNSFFWGNILNIWIVFKKGRRACLIETSDYEFKEGYLALLFAFVEFYGVPLNSTSVAVVDPVANTIDTTSLTLTAGSTLTGTLKYMGGALAPNGKIYCVPRDARNVCIIDPGNNTIDTTSVSLAAGSTFYTSSSFQGGVLAPNGKIYCIPRNAKAIGIIDPVANTFDTTSVVLATGSTLSGGTWSGGTLGMDGKIYGMPRGAGSILVIDPATNLAYTGLVLPSSGSTFSSASRFTCSCLAENGKIYSPPYAETTVLEITPSFPALPPWMLAPEFNKF